MKKISYMFDMSYNLFLCRMQKERSDTADGNSKTGK